MRARRAVVIGCVALAVGLAPTAAFAAWARGGAGSGSAQATSIPAPGQPTASATGRNVTVSWSAVTLPGSVAVSGYIVRRYDGSGSAATVGASCSGTQTGLTCTETGVDPGSWRYGVAAVKGPWRGVESPLSASVVVKTPPSVTGAVIAKSAGGNGGFIKQAGTYYVYANGTAGAPGPGTLALTADVSAITTGQTAVALSAGSWTVDGITYGFRSALLTANTTLAAGTKSFTVTATYDATTGSATSSVTVDNTAPSASDIQTTNGGVAGKIDAGDMVVFTASEQLDPSSLLSGWDGSAIAVSVDFTNQGGGDRFTVWNGANTTQTNLGTVRLGRTDYVTAALSVPGTMTLSGSTITITIGTPPGVGISTAAGSGTLQWTPVATATDRAGNAMSTTARSETGTADVDF